LTHRLQLAAATAAAGAAARRSARELMIYIRCSEYDVSKL